MADVFCQKVVYIVLIHTDTYHHLLILENLAAMHNVIMVDICVYGCGRECSTYTLLQKRP